MSHLLPISSLKRSFVNDDSSLPNWALADHLMPAIVPEDRVSGLDDHFSGDLTERAQ